MADRQMEDINQSGELQQIKLRSAAADARLLTDAEIDTKITTAGTTTLQARAEKAAPSGYAPLDATGRVPLINLPPSAAMPHHIYSTQAAMLAGGPDHVQGEMILVTADPDPAKNGEYIALIDDPVVIADYDHLGDSVSPHRHTGADVDVTPKGGGAAETLQAFVDTSVTKWTELTDTPATIQAFQLLTGNATGTAIKQDHNLMAVDGHLTSVGDNIIITSEPNLLAPTRAEIDIDSSALLHQITMNVLADGQPTLSFSMATNSGFIVSGQTDAFIDGNVGSLITRGYLDGHSKFGTGLEKITEGANSGWRLVGSDPANYGDIGDDAVDFSFQTSPTGVGATGQLSFAAGLRNEASGQTSSAFGSLNIAHGVGSFATGSSTHAEGQNSLTGGSGSRAGGANSVCFGGGTATDYTNVTGKGSFSSQKNDTGTGVKQLASNYSAMIGGIDNTMTATAIHSVVLGSHDVNATLHDTVYLDRIKFTGDTADEPLISAADAGYMYYNTTTNTLKLWNGTAWLTIQTA